MVCGECGASQGNQYQYCMQCGTRVAASVPSPWLQPLASLKIAAVKAVRQARPLQRQPLWEGGDQASVILPTVPDTAIPALHLSRGPRYGEQVPGVLAGRLVRDQWKRWSGRAEGLQKTLGGLARRLRGVAVVLVVAYAIYNLLNFTGGALAGGAVRGGVVDVVMARGLATDFAPQGSTSVFATSEALNCSVRVRDVKAGQVITTRWYQGTRQIEDEPVTLTDSGSGYLGFTFPAGPQGWPPGEYRVEVLLDGRPQKAVSFHVY